MRVIDPLTHAHYCRMGTAIKCSMCNTGLSRHL